MEKGNKRYRLAPGSQVREEDFGLLFYTMSGPRLYFLPCGELLGSAFFSGLHTLESWMKKRDLPASGSEDRLRQVEKSLEELARKGVILEC